MSADRTLNPIKEGPRNMKHAESVGKYNVLSILFLYQIDMYLQGTLSYLE